MKWNLTLLCCSTKACSATAIPLCVCVCVCVCVRARVRACVICLLLRVLCWSVHDDHCPDPGDILLPCGLLPCRTPISLWLLSLSRAFSHCAAHFPAITACMQCIKLSCNGLNQCALNVPFSSQGPCLPLTLAAKSLAA
eukprot:340947-Pelagomonas_calceolata.AAC.2